ncbi:nidogen-1 isoform X2 [Trichomycterus rosablanca]|uniref:nidogen-1 isoform X2 n=1 Tax=Trichomycterus rosablanca TaxID=2290929 RepID=UPI002F35192A
MFSVMARCGGAVCIGLTLVCVAVCVSGLSRSELFLYGGQAGDQILRSGTDENKVVILDRALIFFDDEFEKVYVGTNGFVSVAEPKPQSEYLGKMPASFGTIAAFLGNLDTSDGVGKVYFRQDTDPDVLQQISRRVSQAFPDEDTIQPVNALIVTWENVAATGAPERGDGAYKRRNTFQLVLASTALSTYAILLYPKDDMHYFSTPVNGEDQLVEAGFSKGEIQGWFSNSQGEYHRIPSEEKDSIRNLPVLTNSGTAGVWVYKIGSSVLSDIIPGRVTTLTTEYSGSHQDVYETPAPRKEAPEYPKSEPETPESENTPEDITSAEEILPESVPIEENVQVIQDEYQTTYKQSASLDTEPQQNHPYPRGPRPHNPQVVVIDEQDEDINVNVFSYYEKCSTSAHKCPSSADCRDYATGYCCHCKPGFYGSGKDCVAEGKPQRMNGKVNGRIYVGGSASPVEFSNNDLHSYVVVNDGRAYVAISSIPSTLGHSLQPLSSLGGVIGWAFALEQPEYQNGFRLIGGVFTRQAEVTFQPGGEKLTITQEFKGIDEHDHLVVSTRLEGRIPEVPPGASIQIDPYEEIYQYASNLITSSSTREYTVSLPDSTVRTMTYIWRQTISFQSCPHDENVRLVPPSQQLSVDQVFVMYDSANQLIRYAMTNKIGPVSGPPQQNPCFTGRHGCDNNAICRPGQGNQFTCQCAAGFAGDGRTCYDIDECAETPDVCGSYAVCNNQPGTFRCECMAGFQFGADGKTCVQVHHDIDHCRTGSHDCDVPERARCSYTGGSSYVCSCLPGFVGDGRVCQDIDECQTTQCHRNAVCYNSPGSFTCQCLPGFYGDGLSCKSESEHEKTQCEQERESALAASSSGGFGIFRPRPAVGQYVPQCDPNGDYTPTQCHESIRQCWCVDRNGREIPGTRVGDGSQPMCLDHNAIIHPVGPTPRPDVSPLAPGASLLFAQNGKIEHIPFDGNNMKKEEAKTMLHLPMVGYNPRTISKPPLAVRRARLTVFEGWKVRQVG